MSEPAMTDNNSVGNGGNKRKEPLIDPITALQEGIDGLSLAMFEALRGLRDAVAPESGNLGNNNNADNNNNNNNNNNSSSEPDVEELWQAYCAGDHAVIDMVHTNMKSKKTISKRDDFVKWYIEHERDKDTELVKKLAADVIKKSQQIDIYVHNVPGMNRTRTEQMNIIKQLIHDNSIATTELENTYNIAINRRNQCRDFVTKQTSIALGINEEEN